MAQAKKATKKKSGMKKAPMWNSTSKSSENVKAKEAELFLMMKEKVAANDIIAALKEAGMSGLDLWEAMGVFAIDARDGDGIDFEEIDIETTFTDASDLSFMKNREIHSVFSFMATENQIDALRPYLKKITELFGGFVCTDSDNFQPMIEI